MRKLIRKAIQGLGYDVVKVDKKTLPYADIRSTEFWEIYQLCKPYTMTSVERMYALYMAVSYVLQHHIAGDFVECGVWRGGSSMLIASMLQRRNVTNRKIYLYDTFEGMSEPTAVDVEFRGQNAATMLKDNEHNKETSVWCLAALPDVQQNLHLTGLPENQLVYVQGKVEDTLPHTLPNASIALLRLDTDWYESTKHELVHLYPRLTQRGVLIIDDYGHWEGCRKAVDEYVAEQNLALLFHRIDYTGRIALKTDAHG